MSFRLTAAARQAQLAAMLARADAGASGNAAFRVYATARPATLGSHTDTPMAVLPLARPCGVVDASGWSFTGLADALVVISGRPLWAELWAADATLLADGTVSAVDMGGDFFVSGGAPLEEGETSPMFYAGGLMTVGAGYLT